jgi:hypothetical protein
MAIISASKEPQNPLILRCHRIMDAFAKSNDERDFYLNRIEGFLVYVDLDKGQEELDALEAELEKNYDHYCMVPKLTFYETKKIMEGFITEKVYDIDTKEKLLDIIQSKEARENFLEFISDHHAEFEKWQQFYQERSRIRIIEWLRQNHFHFVFEEDLELEGALIDKLKRNLFEPKVGKDLAAARKLLTAKAKTYYSTEALNPRPKRGRPPKQAMKIEIETQASVDVFLTVSPPIRPFLFIPEITSASAVTFSAKFDGELDLLNPRRFGSAEELDVSALALQQKMAALRSLSTNWIEKESFDDEDEDEEETEVHKKSPKKRKAAPVATKKGGLPSAKETKVTSNANPIKRASVKTPARSQVKSLVSKKAPPKPKVAAKAKPKAASLAKATPKKTVPAKTPKKPVLRSIVKSKKAGSKVR